MIELTRIEHLNQPLDIRTALIARASTVHSLWDRWQSLTNDSYQFTVSIGGSRERKPGVHASELGCERLLVYSLNDLPRRPQEGTSRDIGMQRRFNIGHAVHAMLQAEFTAMCEWLNNANQRRVLTFEEEVGIYPGLNAVTKQWEMSSSMDGIFTFWNEQDRPYIRLGFEIKTKSGPEFDKLVKPEDDHREQTCLYMKAHDLPLMWVLYYNKSNSNVTKTEPPFFYQFDQELWDSKLEPRLVSAFGHREAKTLPDRTEGMRCRWCPFAYTCSPPSLARSRTAHGPPVKPTAFRSTKKKP